MKAFSWLCAAGMGAALLANPSRSAAADVTDIWPISMLKKHESDPAIPESYRRSYKSSRSDIVMMFRGSYWESATKQAARGPMYQQRAFCDVLTESDRLTALIPPGYRYMPAGDGHVLLVRANGSSPADDARSVAARDNTTREWQVSAKPQPKTEAVTYTKPAAPKQEIEEVRYAEAAHPDAVKWEPFTTLGGQIKMSFKGDHWVGRVPVAARNGLPAGEFCERLARIDHARGVLPPSYSYVLIGDGTLAAVASDSLTARLSEQR